MNIQNKLTLSALSVATLCLATWTSWAGTTLFGQTGENERIRNITIREQGDTAFITFTASQSLCYSVRRNGGNIGTICGADEEVTAQMEYIIFPDKDAIYLFCEIQSDINRESAGCIQAKPAMSMTKTEVANNSRPPKILDVGYDNKIMNIRYEKSDDFCYSLDGKRSRIYSASVPGVYGLPICASGENTIRVSVAAIPVLQNAIRTMQGRYPLKLCALYEDACSQTYLSDPRQDFLFDPDGDLKLDSVEGGLPYAPINYVLGEVVLNYTKFSSRCVNLYGVRNSSDPEEFQKKKLVVANICKNGSKIPIGFSFNNISPDLYNPAFVICYPDESKCSNPLLPDYFAIEPFCDDKENEYVCDQIGRDNLFLRNQDSDRYRGPLDLKENEGFEGGSTVLTEAPVYTVEATTGQCPQPSSFEQLAMACSKDEECPKIEMPSECSFGVTGECESVKFISRCESGLCAVSKNILPCQRSLCIEDSFKPSAPVQPIQSPIESTVMPTNKESCVKNTDCGASTCSSECSELDGVCAKNCVMPLCMNGSCVRGDVIRLCPESACN